MRSGDGHTSFGRIPDLGVLFVLVEKPKLDEDPAHKSRDRASFVLFRRKLKQKVRRLLNTDFFILGLSLEELGFSRILIA